MITPDADELVEPGLHGAAGDPEPARGLEHPDAGLLGEQSGSKCASRSSTAASLAGANCQCVVVLLHRSARSREAGPMTEQLTHDELKADLTLEQLKQLVGLVEYDASQRPVPRHRDGRGRLRGRQRHPDRDVLPARARHGPRGLPRPRDRRGATSKTYVLRSGSARFVFTGAVVTPTARSPTTTAGTATASSTSPSRCPTWTSASSTPACGRRDDPRRAARRQRRARHGAHRRDRDVRRDPAHPRRPQPRTTARTCPATSPARRRSRAGRDTRSGCSRPSTTASATSSSAGWTSG